MESELEKAEIERSTYVSEVREVNITDKTTFLFLFCGSKSIGIMIEPLTIRVEDMVLVTFG